MRRVTSVFWLLVMTGCGTEATMDPVCMESSGGAGRDAATGAACEDAGSPIGYSLMGPNVQLLVDASGSMRGARWDELASLVPYIPAVGERANLGLSFFPDVRADCSVTHSQWVPMTRGLDAVDPVVESLLTAEPEGSTPMAAMLREASQYPGLQCPNRDNVVVLLTDGVETCGGDPASEVRKLAEAAEPVEVYVIGFGVGTGTASALSEIAEAARPSTPAPNFYQVSTAGELVGRLQEVTGTCRIQLDEDVAVGALSVQMDGRELEPCTEERCEGGFVHDDVFRSVSLEGADCLALLDGTCHDLIFDRH